MTLCESISWIVAGRPTSVFFLLLQELIHAVLCEDVELAKQVLWAHRDLKVNFRFKVL